MNTTDVVIAGAGIIGLSTALELAEAGLRVTVVERAAAMRESSWAAAGMLAATDSENPPGLRDLAQVSIALYPEYLKRIEALGQVRVPLRTRNTLQASSAGHRFAHMSSSGGRRLESVEADAMVPHLATAGRDLLLLEEASLDPRDLCAALPHAVAAAGVTLLENSTVRSVNSQLDGVRVDSSAGPMYAGAFVNCCGAWSAQVGGTAQQPAIEPRKGQMVTVRLAEGHQLSCVVRTPEIYLVPRGDGRVVIGATVEDAGFDKEVNPDAIVALLERAAALWSPISDASVVESWAGLRPATADGLPIIDSLDDDPLDKSSSARAGRRRHQWIATGHFRNGILLAPATARVVARLVRGVTQEIDISGFRSDRFAAVLAGK